jgi:hypothetical protein
MKMAAPYSRYLYYMELIQKLYTKYIALPYSFGLQLPEQNEILRKATVKKLMGQNKILP